MSFCRSNITLFSKSWTLQGYRHNRLVTLIFCALLCALTLLSHAPSARSEESNTDWPEPLYFPQMPQSSATQEGLTGGAPAGTNGDTQKKTEKKKGIWPFKKRNEDKAKPLTEAQITKVGPKDPPPSPYPLLRLSMPIDTGTGTLAPGIYLLKPAQGKPESSKSSTASVDTFTLTRQNKPVLSFKVHLSNQPDENLKLTGTTSPLSSSNPKAAMATKAETQLSADLKSLTIVIKEGETRLESDPFPISIDKRHILTF